MTSVDYDHNAAALRSEQAALEYELAQVQRELAAARIEVHHHQPQQVHTQQVQPQPQHQLSRNVARITARPSSSRPGTSTALLNGTNLTRAAHEEFLRITARAQSAALRRYFDAVNGHDDFEQRRQERLANAAPFSFEMREMTKPKSRAAERAEQDRLERERAEEEMRNTRFKARPVPASTFEPRYTAMVDDAAAHREAVRAVAQERGLQLVQAEQQRQEFTAAMREAQNELQPRRAKRNMTPDEAFAEWQRTHCQQFRANPVPPTTYSSENRSQADRDATRAMRVKARAEAMLQTARAPPRMEAAASTAVSGGDANPTTTTARGLVARDAFVADLAAKRSLSAVERKRQEREALRERNPNFTFAPQISGDPPAFEALWARERLERAIVKQKYRDYQRHMESTARDFGASDGDGGFTALRAHSAKAAAQREMRLRRAQEAFVRATDGQVPPELLLQQQLGAADAADPLKAAVVLEAAVDDVTRRRASGEAVVGAPVMRSVVGVGARSASAAPKAAAADSRPCQVPRTTHAHVLRAASTYKHIVSRAEEAERKAREDEARRKRQAAANERLRAMGVAPSVKASTAASGGPQAKTRALLFAGPAAADAAAAPSGGGVDWNARAAQKRKEVEEATRTAKAQLDAMKERVRAQPPVFVAEAQAEATLENLTKARAETEARVMAAWRSSGLTPVDMQAALRASAAGSDGGSAIAQDDPAASKTRGGIEATSAAPTFSSTSYNGNNNNLDNHAPQPASATADTRPASPAPAMAVAAVAPAAPVATTTAPARSRASSTSSSSSSSSSSSFASSSSSD